jgi:hypothetical protein
MAESQSDRLKRELRFLKESYEAGIISEEEYNKGKTRIEGKLAEWGEGVVEKYGEKEDTDRECIFDDAEVEEDSKQEKLDVYEDVEKDKEKPVKRINKDNKKPEKKQKKEIIREDTDEFEDDVKDPTFWKWFAVAAVVIIIVMLSVKMYGSYKIDTDLTVLNDKNCEDCDIRSAEAVIDKLFPGITKSYIDYNTREGKAIYNKIGIDYLPAYIFKSTIEQTETWQNNEAIKDSFEKKGEYWVLRADQTNSEWKPK